MLAYLQEAAQVGRLHVRTREKAAQARRRCVPISGCTKNKKPHENRGFRAEHEKTRPSKSMSSLLPREKHACMRRLVSPRTLAHRRYCRLRPFVEIPETASAPVIHGFPYRPPPTPIANHSPSSSISSPPPNPPFSIAITPPALPRTSLGFEKMFNAIIITEITAA